MSEQETTPTEQSPGEEAPSLEALYEQYEIQPAETTQPVNVSEQAPEKKSEAAIQDEILAFRRELAAERERKAVEAEQADLNNAIAKLEKESGLKGKDTVLRGYLIAKAHEDARLKTLWDKRSANPQAWEKALRILGNEVRKEFAVENPQLEENQRAMEESQRAQTTAAPAKDSPEAEVMRMNPANFAQFWGRLAGRG